MGRIVGGAYGWCLLRLQCMHDSVAREKLFLGVEGRGCEKVGGGYIDRYSEGGRATST